MENANFGTELTIDFRTDRLGDLNNQQFLIVWLKEMIKDVGMMIHEIDGKPAVLMDTWAAEGLPHTSGTSICILITTSSISCHTAIDRYNKDKGIVYLNLFSCSKFEYEDVMKSIKKHWDYPEIVKWMKIQR